MPKAHLRGWKMALLLIPKKPNALDVERGALLNILFDRKSYLLNNCLVRKIHQNLSLVRYSTIRLSTQSHHAQYLIDHQRLLRARLLHLDFALALRFKKEDDNYTLCPTTCSLYQIHHL